MTTYNTSRVFETARAMRARLREQDWPAHPQAGTQPKVTFTDADPDGEFEIIQVVPELGEDGGINWGPLPNLRDELVPVLVRISCLDVRDEFDEDRMLDRLELFADVVQRAFFDDVAAATSPTAAITPLDIDNAVKLGGVDRVGFSITSAGNDHRGDCLIRYLAQFRI
jgi:hypothetical protein